MGRGAACVDGARGLSAPHFGGLWQRGGWYDDAPGPDAGGAGDGLCDQVGLPTFIIFNL